MSNNDAASEEHQQQQHESDSDENASARQEEAGGGARSKAAGSSLVGDDSAMGQLESVTCNKDNRATITLKVIQFIGEIPRNEAAPGKPATTAEISQIETDDNGRGDDKSINEVSVVGAVPELDRNRESDEAKRHQSGRSFDDNYRVESPKQICTDAGQKSPRSKRHAMLIQEICESSSSEEVKRFLDVEATALEMKDDKLEPGPSLRDEYRVDSPENSDENNNNKIVVLQSEVMVHEISESSSTESVKNEILASIERQTPPPKPNLKIINIKELPSDDGGHQVMHQGLHSPTGRGSPKIVKKLNKAEEAILEALYGNQSLLQIPNHPLDVISEEGSDCGSDADKQPTSRIVSDELDDEVFLPSSSELSKKPPTSTRKRFEMVRVAEQPQLISTKIIETESNIPESCKSWETAPGDNELQAELVYLTSNSSSATDLSERGDITDTDDVEDTSEDTETNSLLENISVPSLESLDKPLEMHFDEALEIIACQQQIEELNKELRNFGSENEESLKRASQEKDQIVDALPAEPCTALENVNETTCDIACDKKIISDKDKARDDSRMTPRKNSSDSSSSSSNSQCTIIRQAASNDQSLQELCVRSLKESGFAVGGSDDMKITVQRKFNSNSRNAPQIPIINELEMHLECENNEARDGREKSNDRVITIMQVPPEINCPSSPFGGDKKRWLALQSAQIPNLLVALSPLQKSYVMTHPDSNTSADVLLDMHKKFVERRAYHETYESEEIENSQLESASQLEDGYFGDREGSVENIISPRVRKSAEVSGSCDNERATNENISTSHESEATVESAGGGDTEEMKSIRNCILRDEFFKTTLVDENANRDAESSKGFEVKKFELENELKQLDSERIELEDELKNLQSLQHFKREEFLFNEKKLEEKTKKENSNDDFGEFLNSNERLQQELYNEWQDKVLERMGRKLQKTIKITSITEAIHHDNLSERRASENLRIVPLESEFMLKLKERQKRLSLPFDPELNSSTESLHHQNEESKKTQSVPAHLHEFLKYYEEEITQGKNSDESGESKKTLAQPLLFGLIGVSMCLCGLYLVGKFLTQKSKLF